MQCQFREWISLFNMVSVPELTTALEKYFKTACLSWLTISRTGGVCREDLCGSEYKLTWNWLFLSIFLDFYSWTNRFRISNREHMDMDTATLIYCILFMNLKYELRYLLGASWLSALLQLVSNFSKVWNNDTLRA